MDENTLKKQIGTKIKQLRTLKGWSRQQAADKLEMSMTGYGSIERGETDVCITRLAHLAEIFEITLSDLLGLTEKNVFNFTKIHNTECLIGISASSNESSLKHEVRELQLICQSQEKEIEYLKQQVEQLKETNQLLKTKNIDSPP
ncbi:MAG: helix-turn-helix transcriptional regulator [Thiotrichaceae bacterium]